MKVAVLGAGPGGLYAALLLKRADPAREVTVWEQNPAGASYGWGVVFSDTTLAEFREADPKTFHAITDRFVSWDAIDIRYKGALVRASGQPFAGIRRTALLGLLQERCAELGVELRFEERVEDPGALEGDLLVAADGVHSVAREHGGFGTRLDEGAARYIWFGTEVPFDSFLFSFRETEHGVFQAHAYPFDGTTSTFIVEANEEVWRDAGLEGASIEHSIAFCEEMFADDLRGRALLSNNSAWISFVTVRNRRWRDGRVALLGDAAHTAHFSIGSGTKLAMEDAIALARAFERHAEIEVALKDYEADRRPRVERFQEAAAQSQRWFEHVGRYTKMEPERFAFYLLTRSGRIDHTSLRVRDPGLVTLVDRRLDPAGPLLPAPPSLQPLTLRGLTIANRAVVAPGPLVADSSGAPSPQSLAVLAAAAREGPGLLLASAAVTAVGRVSVEEPGIHADEHEAAWTSLAGLPLALELRHAGPRGSMRPRAQGIDRSLAEGWETIAASPAPYGPGLPAPRELTPDEMNAVVEVFVDATERARRAGMDLLVVDMSRGYLLASFISPLSNRRDDRYGGDLEGRMRFPLQVFDAVRAAWPIERPLGATITADDWAPGGAGIEEAVEVARMLRDGGCDLLRPVAGQSAWRTLPIYGPTYLAAFADRIRNEIGIATLAGGAIETAGQIDTLVAAGRADLVLLDQTPES